MRCWFMAGSDDTVTDEDITMIAKLTMVTKNVSNTDSFVIVVVFASIVMFAVRDEQANPLLMDPRPL